MSRMTASIAHRKGIIAAAVVFATVVVVVAPPADGRPGKTTEAAVRRALLTYSETYVRSHLDGATGMLRVVANSPQLDVRDTAIGALLLAEQGRFVEAERAMTGVLAAQASNPAAAEYGNFPYLVGEQPSDPNWSAFIGSYLLVLRDRHVQRFSPRFRRDLLQGISRAAAHQLRVPRDPAYTNMAILSSFVLVRAAEVLGNSAMFAAGKERWEAFVRQTDSHGVGEYNSASYLTVDLYGLGFLADYVKDDAVRSEADRVRQMFWWGITRRYHPQTVQLAGPFSRSNYLRMRYEPAPLQMTLYRESLGAIPLHHDEYYNDVLDPNRNGDTPLQGVLPTLVRRSWPDSWVVDATDGVHPTSSFRERTRSEVTGERDGFQQLTSHLGPTLALGSVNREGLSASHPVVAHARDGITGDVGAFRMRLEAPYGVVTAHIVAVQEGTSILFAVIGDWYYGSPYSRQLTVRLSWIGTAGAPVPPRETAVSHGSAFDVDLMRLPVRVRLADVLEGQADLTSFSWESLAGRGSLDLVATFTLPETPLYTLNERIAVPLVGGIEFADREEVSASALASPTHRVAQDNASHMISWQSSAGLLEAEFPTTPRSWKVDQRVNGVAIRAEPVSFPE